MNHQKQTFKRKRRKSLGQSLVEVTLMFPVLLIMLSGLIELGFLLNFYLDLVDTAREVARLAADDDPVHDETGYFEDSPENDPEPKGFYIRAYDTMYAELSNARQIQLSQANNDDMVISIFSVSSGNVVARYPTAYAGICSQGGDRGWRLYCNQISKFDTPTIEGWVSKHPSARDIGLILVELYYNYNLVMGLPWIQAFIGDPVTLHAYSIMPNRHAAP
jgi:hypothetical protein